MTVIPCFQREIGSPDEREDNWRPFCKVIHDHNVIGHCSLISTFHFRPRLECLNIQHAENNILQIKKSEV